MRGHQPVLRLAQVRLSARWKMGFVTKVLANMMTHKSSADERVLVYKSKRVSLQ